MIETEINVPLEGKQLHKSKIYKYDSPELAAKFPELRISSIRPGEDRSKELLRIQVKIRGSTDSLANDIPSWKLSHMDAIDTEGRIGNTVQNYIREKKKVSISELLQFLRQKGVKNPEKNGSVSEALVILRRDFGRIRQDGYGKNKRYEWIGTEHSS